MTTYWDMDGVLANFHKSFAANKGTALQRKAMANLEPFVENIKTIKSLIKNGDQVYILTAAAHEQGKLGKLDFIAKWLPEFDTNNFICIVGHGKKVDYMREEGILIDDDKKNTNPWIKAGYQAILLEEKGAAVHF